MPSFFEASIPRSGRILRAAVRKLVMLSSLLAVAGMGLGSGSAHALVVKVRGQLWNVSMGGGPFQSNPWYAWYAGDYDGGELAFEFAQAVGKGLGLPNTVLCYAVFGSCVTAPYAGDYEIEYAFSTGPLFAFDGPYAVGDGGLYVDIIYAMAYADDVGGGIGAIKSFSMLSEEPGAVWARATPVPAPLPVLGAAAAFAASRRLRKRLKTSSCSISVASSSGLSIQ